MALFGPPNVQKMKDKKDVEGLIKVMEDHHESKTRVEAADALGAIKDVRAIEPLIKLLGDSDPYLPNHAARALGEIGDVRAVKPLIASLEDEEKGVLSGLREDAARVLGKIGDSSAVEALIRTLEDPYKWLRSPAAEALGEIGDDRAVAPAHRRAERWLRIPICCGSFRQAWGRARGGTLA